MTIRVVRLTPAPDPGDTLLIDGRPAVVLVRLPAKPGRQPAVRITADLPCGTCEAAPLRYDATVIRSRSLRTAAAAPFLSGSTGAVAGVLHVAPR